MPEEQINFFTQYLLFPSVVALLTAIASAIASYKATYKLNQSNKEQEKQVKMTDLVDKLLIEINRLIPLFEKLRSDFEKDNFYSFANIELISSARWRMVNLNNEITLFDNEIRIKILENADNLSTLVDELNALERNPLQNFTDLKTKLEDAIKEDRALRLELFKVGIMIETNEEGNLIPQYIEALAKNNKNNKKKGNQEDKKLQVIANIRQLLLSGVNDAQKRLDEVNADTTRKRDRLVSRILDAQNKLKELQDLLNNSI